MEIALKSTVIDFDSMRSRSIGKYRVILSNGMDNICRDIALLSTAMKRYRVLIAFSELAV